MQQNLKHKSANISSIPTWPFTKSIFLETLVPYVSSSTNFQISARSSALSDYVKINFSPIPHPCYIDHAVWGGNWQQKLLNSIQLVLPLFSTFYFLRLTATKLIVCNCIFITRVTPVCLLEWYMLYKVTPSCCKLCGVWQKSVAWIGGKKS